MITEFINQEKLEKAEHRTLNRGRLLARRHPGALREDSGSMEGDGNADTGAAGGNLVVPDEVALPFFAYGLFRPGQLGFLRLAPHVERVVRGVSVRGELYARDGLPVLDEHGTGTVVGDVLYFKPTGGGDAYASVAELEPARLYRWKCCALEGQEERVNALVGRQVQRGSEKLWEASAWDMREDPLLTVALDVVEETLKANEQFDWSLAPLFRLEMAYLLLWSAIERYTALRYSLGEDVMRKVHRLAEERAFATAVRRHVQGELTVYRADRPGQKLRLTADSAPKKALDFFYQVRSNMVHRGKAVNRDHDLVLASLRSLLAVFRDVLAAAFTEAQRLGATF